MLAYSRASSSRDKARTCGNVESAGAIAPGDVELTADTLLIALMGEHLVWQTKRYGSREAVLARLSTVWERLLNPQNVSAA